MLDETLDELAALAGEGFDANLKICINIANFNWKI